MDRISVVIPSFNRAPLVGRAIRSVLAQIEPGDEVIVVDDESTDDTAAVVRKFGAPVRYVRNVHRGLACGSARNRGVAEARNPLIAFLDSDDEWLPGKLALQRAFMRARPDVVFCFSNFECLDDDGASDPDGLLGWHEDARPWDEILAPGRTLSSVAPVPAGAPDVRVHIGSMYRPLMRALYVSAQSAMVRRQLAGDDLRFAEDISLMEEYDCFARLSKRGPVAYFDCRTFIQHGHAGPRMTDVAAWVRLTARLTVLNRVWGADPAFLSAHGAEFRRYAAKEHLIQARLSIIEGQMARARQALRLAGGGPMRYRLLSLLPGGLIRMFAGAARAVRRTAPRWRARRAAPSPAANIAESHA